MVRQHHQVNGYEFELLLLSHFSRVPLCVTPQTAAHQAPPSLNDEFEQTLGNTEGQGSLACYNPWGRKESDATQRLSNNNAVGESVHFYDHLECNLAIPSKVETHILYNLVNSSPCTWSKETCRRMFIAALFAMARIWKEPESLTVEVWINKL